VNTKGAIRKCVRCLMVGVALLALFALAACEKEATGATPVAEVEKEVDTAAGLVGEWRMLHRGTNILSKVGLSLAADGTYVQLGSRGETVDSGTYTVEGDTIKLLGAPCTGANGMKIDPCVGEYTVVTKQEGGKVVGITLDLVLDPSLSRSLDFGGQEFALPE